MNHCIRFHANDNVATVLTRVNRGDCLTILDDSMEKIGLINAWENIPYGHKIGLREIGKQEDIIKYGERIGRATVDIPQGGYVHVQNVESIEGQPQMIMEDGR
jgi:altronate dehydratase small subunit